MSKKRIFIPLAGILLALIALAVVFVSRATADLADHLVEERIVAASRTAQAYLDNLKERNLITTRVIAASQSIIEYVSNWNNNVNRAQSRGGLSLYLSSLKIDYGMTDIVVTDREGNVVLRTYDPHRYGDSGLALPPVTAALLHGEASVNYAATANMQVGLSSTAPILDNGDAIGAITAMVNMGTIEFVESLARILNAAVTVFSGYTSVASTLYLQPGIRAIGTHAAPHIREAVIEQGQEVKIPLALFGIPHHAFYFPLMGWGDAPVGMFFVGISTLRPIDATDMLQRNIIFIGIASLVVLALALIVYEAFKHDSSAA